MLEMRPDCETCGRDLPNGDPDAVMCTFECTFCSACAHNVHGGVCPNCAGNLTARPTRPEALLEAFPVSTERTHHRPEPAGG